MVAVESGGWTIQSVEWLVYDISSDGKNILNIKADLSKKLLVQKRSAKTFKN